MRLFRGRHLPAELGWTCRQCSNSGNLLPAAPGALVLFLHAILIDGPRNVGLRHTAAAEADHGPELRSEPVHLSRRSRVIST